MPESTSCILGERAFNKGIYKWKIKVMTQNLAREGILVGLIGEEFVTDWRSLNWGDLKAIGEEVVGIDTKGNIYKGKGPGGRTDIEVEGKILEFVLDLEKDVMRIVMDSFLVEEFKGGFRGRGFFPCCILKRANNTITLMK